MSGAALATASRLLPHLRADAPQKKRGDESRLVYCRKGLFFFFLFLLSGGHFLFFGIYIFLGWWLLLVGVRCRHKKQKLFFFFFSLGIVLLAGTVSKGYLLQ